MQTLSSKGGKEFEAAASSGEKSGCGATVLVVEVVAEVVVVWQC